MRYPFGQSFTAYFDPLVAGVEVGNIPTQSPAIYIFDTEPTRDQAASGTDAIQAVTSWTPDGLGFKFTVAAIADPDPTSTTSFRQYFRAVNFVLTSPAGQTQTDIRAIELERVAGQGSRVDVTDEDIVSFFPVVQAYTEEAEREQFIREAKLQVRDELKAKGFRWDRIHDLEVLNRLVKYKAICLILLNAIQKGGDAHELKYDKFENMYKNAFNSLQLEYDSDGDGSPEKKESAKGFIRLVR